MTDLFDFIDANATNQRAGRGSDRVLSCNGKEAPIGDWVDALLRKFPSENPGDPNSQKARARSITVALNNATRAGKQVFGLKFELVSGKPYGEAKPRGPRSTSKQAVKKKAA